MLDAINLGCVRGDRRLFANVNFSLIPGMVLQVHGPNGSGKTSLLRIVCGLLTPAEGEIRWQGENIRALDEEYFKAVTYIGHRNGVKDELTALENLRVSCGLGGVEISRQRELSVLGEMGLGGHQALPARLLSEGQRRRLALARLSSCSTSLWLLDEVLTSLDRTAVALVKSLIEDHLKRDGMAIIATHQELDLSAGSIERLELAS
jgi:heme exporter protein A